MNWYQNSNELLRLASNKQVVAPLNKGKDLT